MDQKSEIPLPEPKEQTHPTTFVKTEADATRAVRLGKRYPGGGVAEFNALKKLRAVAPVNVVKPLRLIEKNGSVVGFEEEFIEGETVEQHLLKVGTVPAGLKEEITRLVELFQKNKIAHGDIEIDNIMVKTDGTVIFIDPVGYGEVPPDELDKLLQLDRDKLEQMLQSLDHVFDNNSLS